MWLTFLITRPLSNWPSFWKAPREDGRCAFSGLGFLGVDQAWMCAVGKLEPCVFT
jgi:hypothetical protein